VRETGSAAGCTHSRARRTRVCTRVRDVDVGTAADRGGRSMRRDAGRRTFRRPLCPPTYATAFTTTAIAITITIAISIAAVASGRNANDTTKAASMFGAGERVHGKFHRDVRGHR